MAYENLLDELKPEEVPLDKIWLDPNNPRFVGPNWQYVPEEDVPLPQIQEATRLRLVREFGIGKLRMNMEVNGFLPIDRVVVRSISGGTFVVLEGNRRICAAKLISKFTDDAQEVSERVLESLKVIPCLVYTGHEQDASWILQGLRHITGIIDWSSFNKARLLVEQMAEDDLSLTDVGKRFGLTPHGAGQWMRGYYAFKQAKERSDFIQEVDERSYPYFQELFSRSSVKVREWLDWSENDREFKNELNFNEFVGWFYPRPEPEPDEASREMLGDWNSRVLRRQDDIRQLAFLISEAPEAFEEFRRERDLENAYAGALAKRQREASSQRYDPVGEVFSALKACTRALENIPLKVLRDPEHKSRLDDHLKDLEAAIQNIRE